MPSLPIFSESPLLPIMEICSDPILIAAAEPWRVVYASKVVGELVGNPAEEVRGRNLGEVLDLLGLHGHMQDVELFWRSGEQQISLTRKATIHSQLQPVIIRACRIQIDQESLLALVVGADLNARNTAGQLPGERYDSLTGLPDRAFLLSRLSALMRGERAADRQFAVLFVDLNNFKRVNDSYGHLIGDRVLREAARRLVHCIREGDQVARFGGDEFVVLVQQSGAQAEVEPIISRIHAVLGKPIALPDGEVTLSVSIVAVEASPEFHSPEDLLAAADRAMYASKRLNA